MILIAPRNFSVIQLLLPPPQDRNEEEEKGDAIVCRRLNPTRSFNSAP